MWCIVYKYIYKVIHLTKDTYYKKSRWLKINLSPCINIFQNNKSQFLLFFYEPFMLEQQSYSNNFPLNSCHLKYFRWTIDLIPWVLSSCIKVRFFFSKNKLRIVLIYSRCSNTHKLICIFLQIFLWFKTM